MMKVKYATNDYVEADYEELYTFLTMSTEGTVVRFTADQCEGEIVVTGFGYETKMTIMNANVARYKSPWTAETLNFIWLMLYGKVVCDN